MCACVSVCVWVGVSMGVGVWVRLATAALLGHHAGNPAVDDVLVGVVVHYVHGGHLAGRTTRPHSRLGHLHQMRVRVPLEQQRFARTVTVVGRVCFRIDDPVPAEFIEVDYQRVPAAPWLLGRLVAR